MSEPKQKAAGELFETRDIQARPLLIFISGLTVLSISVFLAVNSIQDSMIASVVENRDSAHPLSSQRATPRGPLLQSHPTAQLEALRKREQKDLSSLGWVDSQEGIVRLPIELAKQAFLKRQAQAESGD